MVGTPFVSVLMPVFNGERYVKEAIQSILDQRFCNFEFVIINDGSTDNSAAILEYYQRLDQRIKVFTQTNQGIAAARNNAWRLAQGKYIAWADADDISLPDRLGKQVVFLESHPKVGVCGTWVKTIGQPSGLIWKYPLDDATLRSRLLFESPIANPSVMMRRALFSHNRLEYNLAYPPAEDYDFWIQASESCQLANLPQVLVLYRLHRSQSTKTATNWLTNVKLIQQIQLERLGIQPTQAELDLHQAISLVQIPPSREFVCQAGGWLEKLQRINNEQLRYPEPEFSNVLSEWWFRVCRSVVELGRWSWQTYWQSPLSHNNTLKLRTKAKFGVLCVINQIRSKT